MMDTRFLNQYTREPTEPRPAERKGSTTTMRPLITLCIPTYKRPAVLEIALRSIIEQGFASLEVAIGDDSPDMESEELVERMRAEAPFPIRYRHNQPGLGQSANVDALFREAQGRYLILLHDDDLLLPGAIDRLTAPVLRDERVRVVYGKQRYIDDAGHELPEETEKWNRIYERTGASRAIANPLEACLVKSFPNDAFLIDADLARSVGYESDLHVYVDAGFSLRLGQALGPGEMWYEDAFVAGYRRSLDAITTSARSRKIDHPHDAVLLYRAVSEISLPAAAEYARESFIRAIVDSAVKGFALQKNRLAALRLFSSRTYGWRNRLSARGAYHLALIISPAFDRLRRYGAI
jgi:glycosyltransferase involved in cell wall biosynthesis